MREWVGGVGWRSDRKGKRKGEKKKDNKEVMVVGVEMSLETSRRVNTNMQN